MTSITLQQYLVVSGLLFSLGLLGIIIRRNLLVIYMCLELMLNAANLALIAFNRAHVTPIVSHAWGATGSIPSHTGQVFAFFIIAAEAAEVAVGLAIVLSLYRLRRTVRSDEADLLKN